MATKSSKGKDGKEQSQAAKRKDKQDSPTKSKNEKAFPKHTEYKSISSLKLESQSAKTPPKPPERKWKIFPKIHKEKSVSKQSEIKESSYKPHKSPETAKKSSISETSKSKDIPMLKDSDVQRAKQIESKDINESSSSKSVDSLVEAAISMKTNYCPEIDAIYKTTIAAYELKMAGDLTMTKGNVGAAAIPKFKRRKEPKKIKFYQSTSLAKKSSTNLLLSLRASHEFTTLKWLLNTIMILNMGEILENSFLREELTFEQLLKLDGLSLCKVALIDFPRYYNKRTKIFNFPSFEISYKDTKAEMKIFMSMIISLVPLMNKIRVLMLGISFSQLKAWIFLRRDNGDDKTREFCFDMQRKIIPSEINIENEINEINDKLKMIIRYIENIEVLDYCFEADTIINDYILQKK